ncbi:MAG TPA: FemAB family XrtA/PEP-CTERM system-associated protein [Steroidobacteraceae bacterium]|nr:FemAB family XrtA/PEP-CTERM system-associated protein [Steroidobacteraceae bacterium]
MNSALRVRQFAPADAKPWDDFVLAQAEGTFFHLCGWRTVLERAFRHTAHYLVAEDAAGIQGVLPLAHVRSRLFGDSLVSTPFCVYGGVLAANADAQQQLLDAACDLARRLDVECLELRSRQRSRPDWPCKDLYVTFRKPIATDPEVNLKAIPRKQRAVVRKSLERELAWDIDGDSGRLYPLYSESLRNLGTPVFGRDYLDLLQQVFGDACEIQTVTHRGTPVASVLSFYFRDEVLPYYGGGTTAARQLGANDFMYWKLMERAGGRGLRIFDYGRSKRGTGACHFKENWGFEAIPLYYEYYLVRARDVPNLSPTNPRYQLMIATWKRLPLWLTRLIGPPIARALG